MAITTRLSELLAMSRDPEPDPFDIYPGHFDERLNYIFDHEKYHIILTPWDWIVWDSIREYCKQKGFPVPEDPELDIRTIW